MAMAELTGTQKTRPVTLPSSLTADTGVMEQTTMAFVSEASTLVSKKLWDAVCSTAAVHNALQAMLDHSERNHEAVPYLLNTISAAYARHKYHSRGPPTTGVLITLSSHTILTHGDYLSTRAESDWQGFFGAHSELEDVLQGRRLLDPKVMSELILIGECKRNPQATCGRFEHHLCSLKQFRPDIPTVFGFQLEGNALYISSLNPCGMSVSAPLDRGDLASWVALVVRIYDCHEHSDKRFVYRDTADEFARWNISLPAQEPFTLVPFYASRCPGRMTWAGFELSSAVENPPDEFYRLAYKEPAAGFFKLSWQSSKARFKEGELLNRAHADGWLPGLVRHRFYRRFEDDTVSMTADGETEARQLEVLHLASLGEPLSQCRTPEHILSVAYDLLQTHLELLKRGIIHRDLSWFNVLIEPLHHPSTNTKPDLIGIPCIEQILGDPNGKPMALLTDLDHAALKDVIWAPGYSPRKERTGTAMFVACELSSEDPISSPRALKLESLGKRLRAIEEHSEIYNRAFPDATANEEFLTGFRAVMERERARSHSETDKAHTNPDELHRAHHDVESVYWIIQWCFARALPKGRNAFEPRTAPTRALAAYCNTMLDHTMGDEASRPNYMNHTDEGCEKIFHKDLRHFGPMFSAMATYLSVPWHIYLAEGIVKPDHAHHALRRILLLEIISLRNECKQFNLELDTTQPRIYAGMPPPNPTEIRYVKSSSHHELLERDGSAQAGSKRKADQREPDTPADRAPSAKKVKTPRSECEPGSAAQRFHLFWDALRLWFGTGQRE